MPLSLYYMRHTDKLHDIYEDLAKRLENEARGTRKRVLKVSFSIRRYNL